MTHLRIEQNNGTAEDVSSSVVNKLYEIVKEIVSSENLDQYSNLSGKINILSSTYQKYIDYLRTTCPNLTILNNFESYVWFEDQTVEQLLKQKYSITSEGIKPSQIGDNNVHYIPLDTFRNNTTITSFNELFEFTKITVILPFQFSGCSNLTSIKLDNITTIQSNNDRDQGHFADCVNLVSLGDTSHLTSLGRNATFANCSSLPRFDMNPSITTIPKYCFSGCTNLTTFTGANNVTILGNECFRNCSSLTNIDIDWTKITSLGDSCTSGSPLKIPFNDISHIQGIGKYALDGNKTIGSSLVLDSVTYIGEYAFSSNSSITSLVITSQYNVSIVGRAFEFCTNLTTVDLSQSLMRKFDGNGSFLECSSLVSVKLPLTVTQFGAEWSANPLNHCDSLTELKGLDNVTTLISGIRASCNLNHAIYLKELTQGKSLPIVATIQDNRHPYLKQLYMPKFQYSTLTTHNLNDSRAITSMISYLDREPVGNNIGSNSGQLGYIDLIYFRDIQRIAYFQFYGGRFISPDIPEF